MAFVRKCFVRKGEALHSFCIYGDIVGEDLISGRSSCVAYSRQSLEHINNA